MSEIRNQLQTLQGSEITAAQLSTVGGKVFTNAEDAQADLSSLIRWWRAIHVPTYGVPIPGSGKTATGSSVSPTILQPGANETAYVTGLSLINNNATDTATVSITNGNALVWTGDIVAGASAIVVGAAQLSPFYLPNGLSIDLSASGVSPGDVAWTLSYGLSAQG